MDKKVRSIIIVDCYRNSSGKYIYDAIECGLKPVVLVNPKREPFNFKVDAEIIYEKPKYQDTLKLVKSFNPIVIFAGEEDSVELAAKLQHDLHLTFANPYRYLKEQTRKDYMQNALKKAGLRYIHTETIKNVNEVKKIYQKFPCKKVILKAPRACGCDTLSYCNNLEEVTKAAKSFFNDGAKLTIDKSNNELLMQERIYGEEYFINSVSCRGHHKILQIWQYQFDNKKKNSCIFTSNRVIKEINPKIKILVDYIKKTLDALHIKNGPVHSEYMVNQHGPVLIEINCRISGGSLSMEFCDAIFAHHDTDQVLNAVLHPNDFIKRINETKYRTYKIGYIGIINSPRNLVIRSRPLFNIFRRLKSFFDTTMTIHNTQKIHSSIDFRTKCGMYHLLSENETTIENDIDIIKTLEKLFFGLLFEDVNHDKEDLPKRIAKGATLDTLIPNIVSRGLTLILNDKKGDNVAYATVTNLKHVKKELDGFAYGVINLKKNYDHLLREDYVESVLTMMDKIRTGGTIYISERSANLFPYGFKGYKILLKVMGFKDIKMKENYLVATKSI